MFINHSKMIKKGGGRGGAILGILMLLLLTINPVYAQEYTPEPTSTPTPVPTSTRTPYYAPTNQIPISGTPTPLVQGDCPVGARDPDRELSLNWMQKCSKCPTTGGSVITPIPRLPTISYGNLGTPIATAGITSTPNSTSTPNPANSQWLVNYRGYYQHTGYEAERQPDVVYSHSWTGGDEIFTNLQQRATVSNSPITEYIIGFHHWGSYSVTSSYTGPAAWNLNFTVWNGSHGDIDIISSDIEWIPVGRLATNIMYEGIDRTLGTAPGGVMTVTGTFDITFNVTIRPYNAAGFSHYRDWIHYVGWPSAMALDLNSEYTIGGYTLTPPIDQGYCNNYVYADEEEADDPLVGMPDISIWQGQCLDFVPPFSWFRDSAGSYLFDVDLSFPGIGICPIWVELGDMELAGISIPMDILFLPAVMFIFGLLFKM